MIDLSALLDVNSAAIVLGGTTLTTMLRSGVREMNATGTALMGSFKKPFDYTAARAKIAKDISEIQLDGFYRAQATHSTDKMILDATDALIRKRSIQAAFETHERHKKQREKIRERAVKTLCQAAELSPVFGLVGTLISLSQIPADGLEAGNLMGAVSMAVVSTFYGLILGQVLIMPLVQKIERMADYEEYHRERLMLWMAQQLQDCDPASRKSTDRRLAKNARNHPFGDAA